MKIRFEKSYWFCFKKIENGIILTLEYKDHFFKTSDEAKAFLIETFRNLEME